MDINSTVNKKPKSYLQMSVWKEVRVKLKVAPLLARQLTLKRRKAKLKMLQASDLYKGKCHDIWATWYQMTKAIHV